MHFSTRWSASATCRRAAAASGSCCRGRSSRTEAPAADVMRSAWARRSKLCTIDSRPGRLCAPTAPRRRVSSGGIMGERIVMLGTGAVGGYVGGHLALHGYDVTLIDFWHENI